MGRGLIRGILTFSCDNDYQPSMPRGRAISVLSHAVWWAKLEKNDKVRHNMTQIASLLAVEVLLLLIYGLHFTVREGGLYARQ